MPASQISEAIRTLSLKDEARGFGHVFLSHRTDLVPLRFSPVVPNVGDGESSKSAIPSPNGGKCDNLFSKPGPDG
jgi:hypothetical protein